MNRFRLLSLFILATSLLLSGCAVLSDDPLVGYIYTNKVIPYTEELNNTPVATASGKSSIVRIQEPFSDLGIYTELNTNAIGEIARENGFKNVHYADLESFSLFRIWRSQTLIIYGEQ